MVLARRFDERMLRLQRQGRIGTFAPIKGQEAAQVGSVATLRRTDWMVPSFRETASMLWRGWPMEKILLFFSGYLEGGRPEPEQRDLPICIPVATQLPHAVGLAYAAQYRGDDAVVMAYCGDGATSEGDFHEAMNFAGVWHVPVVFIVPEQPVGDLDPAQEADPLAHHRPEGAGLRLPGPAGGRQRRARGVRGQPRGGGARAPRRRARRLIECVTYRLGVHTTSDDPTKYRSTEEVEAWERKDPLTRFRAYLAAAEPARAGPRGGGRRGDRARRSRPSRRPARRIRSTMFDHAYGNPPAALAAQRAEMAARLGRARPSRTTGPPPQPAHARTETLVAKLNMVKALNLALLQEMERDPDVLVIGEDVGVDGGVFRVTEDLHRKFGGTRVMDSPLAEAGIIGASVGMALYGLKPVCEIQFSGFAFQCFHQIENHVARYRMRTQGRFGCQMVVRMPYRRRGARARAPLGERGAVLRPHPRPQDGDPLGPAQCPGPAGRRDPRSRPGDLLRGQGALPRGARRTCRTRSRPWRSAGPTWTGPART